MKALAVAIWLLGWVWLFDEPKEKPSDSTFFIWLVTWILGAVFIAGID